MPRAIRRLVMAKMLYDLPSFLVLDEPTNHMDMATKEMLISALANFEGTIQFVCHDRHFLAALSNRVLEPIPEGIHRYGGRYMEYVARPGQEAPGLRREGRRGALPKLHAGDPRWSRSARHVSERDTAALRCRRACWSSGNDP